MVNQQFNFLGVEKIALLFICIFSQLFIIASPVREGSEFTSYFALLAIAIYVAPCQ